MRIPELPRVITCVAGALLAACGGGGDSTSPAPAASITYTGVFSSGMQRGSLSLTAGASATGSLRLGGSATVVPLSGTYNSSTKTFTMTGGGYSVSAKPVASGSALMAASAAGTGAGANVVMTDPPVLTGTVSGGALALNASLTVMSTTSTATPTRYCGVWTGTDAGMFDLLVNGSTAAANIAGMGGSATMTGTVNGNTVTLSVTTNPPEGRNTLSANLTLNGTSVTGSGSSTLYPSDVSVLAASSTGCADSPPTAPFTSYVGLVYKGSVPGKITLVPGTPATGSITFSTLPTVALTGTYTPATGAFSVTGGGYTVTASTNATGFTGSVVSGDAANGASIIGLGSNATTTARRYCGNYSGGRAGNLWFVISGTTALLMQQDNGVTALMNGSAGPSWVYGTIGANWFYAGTGTSTSMSGSWTNVDDKFGNWTAPSC